MSATDQDTKTMNTGSPKDRLAIAKAKLNAARGISMELQKALEALKRKVEPELASDQEQLGTDPQGSFALASLGIEAASKEKESL